MTLLGRGSVCINSGGEKIYPEEVEAALKAHDAVFDVVVVGVPDERWGERVAAVVEMRPDHDATLEELDAHVRTLVAGYKVPRELHLVDKIERSPSGKPDYRWAKDIATGVKSSYRQTCHQMAGRVGAGNPAIRWQGTFPANSWSLFSSTMIS